MRGKRGSRVIAVAGIALWVAVPIALAIFTVFRLSPTEFAPRAPVWAAVERSPDFLETDAAVAAAWNPAGSVFAPSWSGLVQRVLIAPGDEISNGTQIVELSGITRIAAETTIPFDRPLALGASGEDVEQFHRLVNSLGITPGEGDRFTTASSRAAAELGKRLGALPDNARSADFDPSWVVFVPSPLTVQSIELSVGAPAPAPGTGFISTAATLSAGFLADAALLDRVAGLETFDPRTDLSESERVTLPDRGSVLVGQTSIEIDEDGNAVMPGSLSELQGLMDPLAFGVRVTVQAPVGDGEWSVPASALITDPDGTMCVLARDASADERTVTVTVTASVRGEVVVAGELHEDTEVAVGAAGTNQCG